MKQKQFMAFSKFIDGEEVIIDVALGVPTYPWNTYYDMNGQGILQKVKILNPEDAEFRFITEMDRQLARFELENQFEQMRLDEFAHRWWGRV